MLRSGAVFVLGAMGGLCDGRVGGSFIGGEGSTRSEHYCQRGRWRAGCHLVLLRAKLVWAGQSRCFYPRCVGGHQSDSSGGNGSSVATLGRLVSLWAVRRRWRGSAGGLALGLSAHSCRARLFERLPIHLSYVATTSVLASWPSSPGSGRHSGRPRACVVAPDVGRAGVCIRWVGTLAVLTSTQSRQYDDCRYVLSNEARAQTPPMGGAQ